MIYLHKLIPYIVYPITISLLLMAWALLTKKRSPLLFAFLLLLTTSLPITSDFMLDALEAGQIPKQANDLQKVDAIVVLSGMISPIHTPKGLTYEWGDPDRFFGGVKLIKAGVAPRIIFTGGILPWQNDVEPEGIILKRFAIQMGVDGPKILVTGNVQSTADEAKAVKAILDKNHWQNIILVTSAFHMPRAQALFQNEGIGLQTYPVDFKSRSDGITPMDFLPSAQAFGTFEFAFREFLGRTYYNFLLPFSGK